MMSKLPLCFSRCWITPIRPLFLPPVTITMLPMSNLMNSTTFPVSRLIFTVSLALIRGSGYLMVRPSKVVMCGTPLSPNWAALTLHSLYCNKSTI
ncbi:hypothetical protein KC19_9G141400, partial [Ceratodon purpureus]